MTEWTLKTLKELMEIRFAAAEQARAIQAIEYARRLAALNNSHQEAKDKERDFVSVEKFDATFSQTNLLVSAMDERVRESLVRVHSRLDVMEGRSTGLAAGWGYLVGGIGALAAAVAIILAFTR